MSWFRQLTRGASKFFGRQLPQSSQRFGRQLHSAVRLLPSAFKDTSKVYSNLEKHTQGMPLVSKTFGFASKGTQSIGDLLSGNFGKALTGGKQAISQGRSLAGDYVTAGEKYGPYFA